MEMKEKIKKKGSRSVSIFTILIWLALVVVMTTITISGITAKNAVEQDSNVLRIRVKVEGLDTEEVRERYENLYIRVSIYNRQTRNDEEINFNFVQKDSDGNYVYELSKQELENKLKECKMDYYYIEMDKEEIEGYAQNITSDDFHEHDECLSDVVYSGNVDYIVNISYVPEARIRLNLTVDGIDDEAKLEKIYNNAEFTFYLGQSSCEYKLGLSYLENGIGIFELNHVPNGNVTLQIHKSFLYLPYEIEINGEKTYAFGYIDMSKSYHCNINSGEELVINVRAYSNLDNKTKATQNVKWIDQNTGKAQIELGYTSTSYITFQPVSIYAKQGTIIYEDVLSEDFVLSSEYEHDSKWSILETTSNEMYEEIPKDVYDQFYVINEDSYTGKEYVYVKDTNTVYWYENDVKMKQGSTTVNVIYKEYEAITNDVLLDKGKEAKLLFNGYFEKSAFYQEYTEKYNIASPNLKFSHTAESLIKVSKTVAGEKGNHTYYVGLFTDEISEKTDRIYKIDTVDGKGNITIELDNKYNIYYIYEVDENGNKLSDEKVNYNKNKVEFKNYIRDAKITTDSSVVSSVVSGYCDNDKWKEDEEGKRYFEINCQTDVNDTVGAGEANYIDNVLSVKDIYQEDIIISSEKVKYKVTYVPEEGGSIEGETGEKVSPGETPGSVPTPKAEEGYEFVRWEVEENGERVEVNPNEYVIEKDTVFYAIFKKMPVENPVDTSDIHVELYIIISIVAIVGIVSVVYYSIKTKKKKINK